MAFHQKLFLLLVFLLPVQLGRHFWPDFSYLMGLRVDYLSPTLYLTDLLVFLILGFWGIKEIKNQKSKIKITIKNLRFLFFFFSIFIFLLVNSLVAKNPGAAFYKFFKICEFGLLGLYVAKNHYSLFTICFPLVLAVVYSSLLAYAQFLKQSSLGGVFWWLGERTFNAGTPGIAKMTFGGRLLMRPYATFPHPNALAGFILLSLILTLPFLFKKSRLLAVGYLLLAGSALGLTFSRSVFLGGLMVLFFWLGGKEGFFLFLLAIILGIKFLIFPQEAFWQRLKLAEISFRLIKQFPLIGVGLNNFIVHLTDFWQPSILWLQPVHNIYLLVASETGVIGLVLFSWILFLTFKKIQKMTPSYRPIFLSSYLSILFLGFFDHYWLTLQQNQLLLTIIFSLIWSEKVGKIKVNEGH